MDFLSENLGFLCSNRGLVLDDFLLRFGVNDSGDLNAGQLVEMGRFFKVSLDELLVKDLAERSLRVTGDLKFLILDVDGVLTDGGMYYSETGEGDEFKKFNAKDGMGIKLLQKKGFEVGLLSSGTNANLIRRRAKTLGIKYVHAGREPKVDIFHTWCKELGIKPKNAIHFGDDVNDIPLMKIVGLSVCPADAVVAVQQVADLRMTRNGGFACVREFIDEFLLPFISP